MGLELQEAAEYWAGPEGVALRKEAEVTGSSAIPAFSRHLSSLVVNNSWMCLIFEDLENFLKQQLLCWPPRTFSSSSCPLPGQRSCWAGKGAGAEQGCGAGVHFLPPLPQLCCGYLTIIRKFEIL